jgi:arylsulfatase A-like enzyme
MTAHHGIGVWPTDDDLRRRRWADARLSALVDREIGRILDGLETAGLADDTLVVFSSDHGDQNGSHDLAHKRCLYDESARVPLLVAGPGVVAGQVDTAHLVSNGIDFFATVCDYAGCEPPAGLAGRSLRPILEGEPEPAWRGWLVCEVENTKMFKSLKGRMVRSGRFKYMVYERGRNREQLLDMDADPGEMKNLARHPEFADVLQQHREYLREWCEQTDDTFGGHHYPHPDVRFMVPGDAYSEKPDRPT